MGARHLQRLPHERPGHALRADVGEDDVIREVHEGARHGLRAEALLRPDPRRDVGEQVALRHLREQAVDRFRAGRDPAVELADVHRPFDHELEMPRVDVRPAVVRQGPEGAVRADRGGDHVLVDQAVLQRDDEAVRPEQMPDPLDGLAGVLRLHREQHALERIRELVRGVRALRPEAVDAPPAVDPEARRPERLDVLAVRVDERDVLAAHRQPGARQAADRARSDDRDPHAPAPGAARPTGTPCRACGSARAARRSCASRARGGDLRSRRSSGGAWR